MDDSTRDSTAAAATLTMTSTMQFLLPVGKNITQQSTNDGGGDSDDCDGQRQLMWKERGTAMTMVE